MRERVSRHDPLTTYDVLCGKLIEESFAAFQGVDPLPQRGVVFAALVHRSTEGHDDGSHNPLLLDGVGWFGSVSPSDDVTSGVNQRRRARFETIADGCRAAAVACQFPEFQSIQIGYRAGDIEGLARVIEASPLGRTIDLVGLSDDVRFLDASQKNVARRVIAVARRELANLGRIVPGVSRHGNASQTSTLAASGRR